MTVADALQTNIEMLAALIMMENMSNEITWLPMPPQLKEQKSILEGRLNLLIVCDN